MSGLATASRGTASATAASPARATLTRLAAVIPCHDSVCLERVVAGALAHVDELVIVADGCPPRLHAELDRISRGAWAARVVWIEHNSGKGDAVAAGIDAMLRSDQRPDAIIVLDADGQHPPELIPQFAAAAREAELVIGDRLGDTAPMPLIRRFTNRVSSVLLTLVCRQRMRDSQCGMRLYRSELLERVPPPPGRYEAETLHLRALIRAGARVAWVQMPTIYDGAASFFRPARDTARVLAAIVLPAALVRAAASMPRWRRARAAREARPRLRSPTGAWERGCPAPGRVPTRRARARRP